MNTANTLVPSQSYSGQANVESALPCVKEDALVNFVRFRSG